MKRSGLWSAITLCLLCFAAAAQTNTSGFTPAAIQPGTPAGSYLLKDFDSVNLSNGYLNIRLPLVEIGGRGKATTVLMPNFSMLWQLNPVIYSTNCGQGQGGCSFTYHYQVSPQTAGWQTASVLPLRFRGLMLGGMMIQRSGGEFCNYAVPNDPAYPTWWQTTLTRLTYIAPDGTETELVDKQTGGTPQPGSRDPSGAYNRGTQFVSHDGTSAVFTASDPVLDTLHCATPSSGISGTLVTRDGVRHTFVRGYETSIEDTNGNLISLTDTAVTDALGRQYQISTVGACDEITYAGSGGTARTIKVCHDKLSNLLRKDQSLQPVQTLWSLVEELTGIENRDQVFDLTDLIAEIDLPDGSAYHFQYDSYGNVARLVLPTGGAVEYDYQQVSAYDGNSQSVAIANLVRQITSRREYLSASDTTPSHVTQFQGGRVTEYDGQNHLLSKTDHYMPAALLNPQTNPTLYESTLIGKETETKFYAADGVTVLKDVVYNWQLRSCGTTPTCGNPAGAPFDPLLLSVTTTQGGVTAQTQYAYDAYNNRTETYEYDWGAGSQPGALLRHTTTSYVTDAAYVNPAVNLVSLPSQQNIYAGLNSLAALTYYHYDEASTALTNEPGLTGHDASFGVGYTVRGNLTSQQAWVNSLNSQVTTQYAYDIAGNRTQVTDPLGRVTRYDYTDPQNTYAHPTTITNALNQKTTAAYDYNTGQVSSQTDRNGVVTAYTYDDALDRLTQVVQAQGLAEETQTNIAYVPMGPGVPNSIIQQYGDLNASGDRLRRTDTFYDGFGRLIQTNRQESVSQNGTVYNITAQSYDALGRLAQVSNPYRLGDTPQYTQYNYDALGRTLTVTTPDGVPAQTSYQDNTTTVSDAAQKTRTLTTDALGRLTQVLEAPGSLHYQTTYTYDALDQLTGVTQGSETRSFVYDSLGRLTSATNPESNTTTYQYDAVGNLTGKTDARGVTITSAYDALNRLTSRTYPTDPNTPTDTYVYDDANAAHRGFGRLRSAGNSVSTTAYTYDALGRVATSAQTTAQQTYAFAYGYNRAGALLTETYPSGRVLSTGYDDALRPTSTTGAWGGVTTPYVTTASYTAHNALSSFGFGNGLSQTNAYNTRLQLQNWGTNSSRGVFLQEQLTYGAQNNGNIQQIQEDNGDPGNPRFLRFTSTYTYDDVNRLQSVTDAGGGYRSYNYDAYGNQWISGSGTAPNPNEVTANNYVLPSNRINGLGYDAAGNVIDLHGTTLVYDAAGRQTAAAIPGFGTAYYSYDADGHRVRKAADAGQTIYVYDALGRLVAEYNSGVSHPAPCATCYLTTDHLGSTRLVSDANLNIVARHDYLPFGEELTGVWGRVATDSANQPTHFGGNDNVNQQFTGKERDAESGLDYFGARYYGGALGRFTSPDPISGTVLHILNPQRWNMYAYAVNNPLAFVDPDGQDAIAVKYANLAHGLGHAGVGSVHKDGKGTYADFGPQHGGQAHDAGKYNFIDIKTQIQYGADGKPTKESLSALANELADDEGQPHDSVSVAYFKTSDAETMALDAYINAAKNQQSQGKDPTYWVGFRDCIWFCSNGLQKAGIGGGSSIASVPNFNWLSIWMWSEQTATGTKTDPENDRQPPHQRCLQDRDGNCVVN